MIRSNQYNEQFENKLNEIVGKVIMETFKANKCVIGGSTVISEAMEKFFPLKGLDIYVPSEYAIVEFTLQQYGGILDKTNDSHYDGTDKKIKTYVMPFYPTHSVKSDTPINVRSHFNCITLIETGCDTVEDIRKFIENTADLTICQSCYDFEHMYLHPDVEENIAHVCDHVSRDMVTDIRCALYATRDFEIKNHEVITEHSQLAGRFSLAKFEVFNRIAWNVLRLVDICFRNEKVGETYYFFGSEDFTLQRLVESKTTHCVYYKDTETLSVPMMTFERFPQLRNWQGRLLDFNRKGIYKAWTTACQLKPMRDLQNDEELDPYFIPYVYPSDLETIVELKGEEEETKNIYAEDEEVYEKGSFGDKYVGGQSVMEMAKTIMKAQLEGGIDS